MTSSAPLADPAQGPALPAGHTPADAIPGQWQLEVLQQARKLARRRGHDQITMEHLALVLLDSDPSIARHWRSLGIDDERARRELAPPVTETARYGRSFRFHTAPSGDLVVTKEVAAFFGECAGLQVSSEKRPRSGDLAAAILTHLPEPLPGSRILAGTGAQRPPVSEHKPGQQARQPGLAGAAAPAAGTSLGSVLDSFGRDLTELASMGRLDPLVGREREVEAVLRVLRRRTKRNPLLIGEPGVGKTAIVEGVAHRLAAGEVTGTHADARLVAIDLGGLLGGTRYRGEFEGRVHELIDEVLTASRPTILFIDEFHLVARTGAAEGGIDLASMVLAPMARGQLAIIGATTPADFRRHLRHTGPLVRRVQLIQVEEPDPGQTLAILTGTRGQYEDFHDVKIDDDALSMAVTLARRRRGQLPDAALDIIDDAAALARQRAAASEIAVPVTACDVARLSDMPRATPGRLPAARRHVTAWLRRRGTGL